jgi:hypothetical protein
MPRVNVMLARQPARDYSSGLRTSGRATKGVAHEPLPSVGTSLSRGPCSRSGLGVCAGRCRIGFAEREFRRSHRQGSVRVKFRIESRHATASRNRSARVVASGRKDGAGSSAIRFDASPESHRHCRRNNRARSHDYFDQRSCAQLFPGKPTKFDAGPHCYQISAARLRGRAPFQPNRGSRIQIGGHCHLQMNRTLLGALLRLHFCR